MTWPAYVIWFLILAACLSRGPAILYLFSILGAFQTLQMLPSEAFGGVTLVPQPICAAFLIGKFALRRGNLMAGLAVGLDIRRLALLIAFLVYAVITAFILPLLFQDRVTVITVVAPLTGLSMLRFSSQNITQSGYMTISVLTCVVFAVLGSRREFRQAYLVSLVLGGVTLIVTGLVDLVTYTIGLSAVLEPFRNATYALFLDSEALGSKRVVGLMPEASAYGAACIASASALTFLRPLFTPRLGNTVVPMVSVALLVMTVISTSSGAYIGVVIFAAAYGLNLAIRMASPHAIGRKSLEWEITLLTLGGFAALSIVVLTPSLLTPLLDLVDHLIFQKTATSSYLERTYWTSTAWDAFKQTSGWGVGIGGVRTSNWFVSILSSTGFFGGLLMFGFIAIQLFGRSESTLPDIRELRRGVRLSLLPPLVISWFSGTIPDFGGHLASLYGVIASTTRPAADDAITNRTS